MSFVKISGEWETERSEKEKVSTTPMHNNRCTIIDILPISSALLLIFFLFKKFKWCLCLRCSLLASSLVRQQPHRAQLLFSSNGSDGGGGEKEEDFLNTSSSSQ